MLSNGQKYIGYFDSLRLIAAIAVIMVHVGMYEWREAPLDSEWHMINFFHTFTRFCVPIFFMISGALFLSSEHEIKISKLYRKNIARFVVIYVVWTVFYALYCGMVEQQPDTIIRIIFRGQHHLWFLPSLLGLYILVPVLQLIVKNRTVWIYFTVLSLFVTFGIYSLGVLPNSEWLKMILDATIGKIHLHYVRGDLAYFLLGYFLFIYDVPKWVQKISLPASILSGLGVTWLTANAVITTDVRVTSFTSYHFILVASQSAFLFIFFKYYNDRLFTTDKIRNLIARLSPYLLGVYLIHDAFLIFFRANGLTILTFDPLTSNLVMTLLTFIGSVLVTYIIKKIPVIHKYLV